MVGISRRYQDKILSKFTRFVYYLKLQLGVTWSWSARCSSPPRMAKCNSFKKNNVFNNQVGLLQPSCDEFHSSSSSSLLKTSADFMCIPTPFWEEIFMLASKASVTALKHSFRKKFTYLFESNWLILC